MTEKLDKAVAQAKQLPSEQQDALAAIIIEEIEDEARWDDAFAKSHDMLSRLASEAEQEDRTGQSKELNPDEL